MNVSLTTLGLCSESNHDLTCIFPTKFLVSAGWHDECLPVTNRSDLTTEVLLRLAASSSASDDSYSLVDVSVSLLSSYTMTQLTRRSYPHSIFAIIAKAKNL